MFTPQQLSKKLGVSKESLRQWEIDGDITATKTSGGHRRYIYHEEEIKRERKQPKLKIVYGRVSSSKQKGDLRRQINDMRSKFPRYKVMSDIGSGINFKRKSLLSILELVFQ